MVEYAIQLNNVFMSLADATRRDILARVIERPRSIGELAEHHKKLTFAAIAKHIAVLETARLVTKKRAGRHQIITANQATIADAAEAVTKYKIMLDQRFDQLDALLQNNT